MKQFDFTTSDAIRIFGLANEPSTITKRILCLHMMPAAKESYQPFMAAAEPLGWLVWSIDFRGHGASTQEGSLDYHQFSPAEHAKYEIDAYNAYSRLQEIGPVDAVIGASIGANVALQVQMDAEIPKSVLISPGLSFYGVETLPAAQALKATQSCMIITSESDGRVAQAADQAQTLFQTLATPSKSIETYPGSEHGTDIVMPHPDRLQKIIDFLK